MTLIDLIIVLLVVGVLLYIITLIPMDATIRKVIHIVVLVAVILWLLQAFGVLSTVGSIHVGR